MTPFRGLLQLVTACDYGCSNHRFRCFLVIYIFFLLYLVSDYSFFCKYPCNKLDNVQPARWGPTSPCQGLQLKDNDRLTVYYPLEMTPTICNILISRWAVSESVLWVEIHFQWHSGKASHLDVDTQLYPDELKWYDYSIMYAVFHYFRRGPLRGRHCL